MKPKLKNFAASGEGAEIEGEAGATEQQDAKTEREAEAQQELGKKSGIGGSILSLPSPLSLSLTARILSAVVGGSGCDAPCSDLPAGAAPPEWAVRREGEHAGKTMRIAHLADSIRIRCEFECGFLNPQ